MNFVKNNFAIKITCAESEFLSFVNAHERGAATSGYVCMLGVGQDSSGPWNATSKIYIICLSS
jgi:hypothetical protein